MSKQPINIIKESTNINIESTNLDNDESIPALYPLAYYLLQGWPQGNYFLRASSNPASKARTPTPIKKLQCEVMASTSFLRDSGGRRGERIERRRRKEQKIIIQHNNRRTRRKQDPGQPSSTPLLLLSKAVVVWSALV